MKITLEYIIIALLLIAFLYYFFTHQSLLSDLSRVPDTNNPKLKMVKDKHISFFNCVNPKDWWICDSGL